MIETQHEMMFLSTWAKRLTGRGRCRRWSLTIV